MAGSDGLSGVCLAGSPVRRAWRTGMELRPKTTTALTVFEQLRDRFAGVQVMGSNQP